MACVCLPVCFIMYIFISLLFHTAELVLNVMFVVNLYLSDSLQTWFTIIMGLMLLPMVMVQLVSALLLLQKRGEHLTCFRALATAIIHMLQLGFIWRHIRILKETEVLWKKRDLADLCLLRLFYAFSASLPILGIQTYFIITFRGSDWLTLSAAGTTLMSACWALASFRRQNEMDNIENIVLTCPGTFFRILWRVGEVVARLLSLAVFASVNKFWVFLVIGLHWMTMLVCICTSFLGVLEITGINRCHRFFLCLLVSYIYLFCHVNFNSQNARFRYITYYTIMFLENAVLTVVWYLKVDDNNSLNVHTIVFILCSAFFIGIASMLIYYRFFHIPSSNISTMSKDAVCIQDGCINCKLSLCVKHCRMLQRPFSSGWTSRYHEALYNGEYYKILQQDSLIDSASEWEKASSVSGFTHLADSDNKEDNVSPFMKNNKKTLSFMSSGTYSHRRFIQKENGNNVEPDCDTESSCSTDSQPHLMLHASSSSEESDEYDTSVYSVPPEMTNSRTCLLTDSWDNLMQYDNMGFDEEKVKLIPGVRPIPAQNLEDWYSDGYSTDHTDSTYQLPITVLAKSNSCRISVASDSTECTMCRHMKSFNTRLVRKYSRASSSQISRQDTIKEEEDRLEVKNTSKAKPPLLIVNSPRGHAWYNCSESGDSAFAQENFSSTLESTFSEEDGVSETSYELII